MGPNYRGAADQWAGFASAMVARWTAHASTIASHLDTGEYSVGCAVRDLSQTAALAADSSLALANETFECLAALSGRLNAPVTAESEPFHVPVAFAGAQQPIPLSLQGPLRNAAGTDALPVHAVTIEPAPVPVGQTQFAIHVDAQGHEAGTYFGVVIVGPPAAGEHVAVWVVVP